MSGEGQSGFGNSILYVGVLPPLSNPASPERAHPPNRWSAQRAISNLIFLSFRTRLHHPLPKKSIRAINVPC